MINTNKFELTQTTITFGKYKGKDLSVVLRDRKYCKWLIEEDWFENDYEFLYNRIKEYDPIPYFISPDTSLNDGYFLDNYKFFNLLPIDKIELPLTSAEQDCYNYYLHMIQGLKNQIYDRLENDDDNPYDIVAPTNWLKRFEKDTKIQRQDFKEFLAAYELPNIPYIVERIKQEGGLIYKGAKSFIIAKHNSMEQESWWHEILKRNYGENVSSQYKYEHCVFDFLVISTNTIFECKLDLKYFNEEQHKKYQLTLSKFNIIYLISTDCVINLKNQCIYTTNTSKYEEYIENIPDMKNPSYLDILIKYFKIIETNDIVDIC